MKKKVLVGLAILAAVALLAGGTWAWFTAEAGPVVNTFTAGTVKISVGNTYEDVINWNPGDVKEGAITVTNEGSKCAYVRVTLTPEWGSIKNGRFVKYNRLSVGNVALALNTEEWVADGDYYYYKAPLCPEDTATTANLLSSVTLEGAQTGNKYQGKVFRITVKAEAVQSSNDAYKDVWNLGELPWEEEDVNA